MSDREASRRWRLILGGHADAAARAGDGGAPGAGLGERDGARDAALEYLYRRERGTPRGEGQRGAGREAGALTPVTWLREVRKVFPKSAATTLEKTAVERYGMLELLTDREALASARPSLALVATLLSFRASLPEAVMGEVRRIVGAVVRELEQRLAQQIRQHFGGRRLHHQHGGRRLLANLDWRRTISRNLRHYDAEHESLVLERLYFNPRDQRRVPWHFFLVVDQSGSMVDSVIYSAVVGSTFLQVPSLTTHLLVFDTEVVDLSGQLDDPLETLLAVQLGGGTDIANAMRTTRELVTQPHRTIVVLVSDFEEGGSVPELVEQVSALRESGVTLLGLSALTEQAKPYLDHAVAARLTAAGMSIGTMTPDRLAAWVADRIG